MDVRCLCLMENWDGPRISYPYRVSCLTNEVAHADVQTLGARSATAITVKLH